MSDLLTYIWLLGREAEPRCQRSSISLGSGAGGGKGEGALLTGAERVGFLLLTLPGQLWNERGSQGLLLALMLQD